MKNINFIINFIKNNFTNLDKSFYKRNRFGFYVLRNQNSDPLMLRGGPWTMAKSPGNKCHHEAIEK